MYKLLNNSHLLTKPRGRENENNITVLDNNNRESVKIVNSYNESSITVIDKMLEETMG